MQSFKKIINLIRKTKSKFIIINPDSEDTFVVLPLEEYEEILENKPGKQEEKSLTENKFIDKINRDIALKIYEEKSFEEDEIHQEDALKEVMEKDTKDEEERFYFEPIE